MSTPTRVRVTEPQQFLPYVPYLVGYEPRDCLVLVALSASGSSGAMRIALPERPEDTALFHEIIDGAIGNLMRIDGLIGMLPVVYTSESFAGAPEIPHGDLALYLMRRARQHGLELPAAFCVAADGWDSYLDRTGDGRPRPLDDIRVSEEFACDPRHRLIDHRAELELPQTSERERSLFASRRRTQSEVGSAMRTGGCAVGESGFAEVALEGASIMNFAEHCLGQGDRLGPVDASALAIVLEHPLYRDVVLHSWAWGPDVGSRVMAALLAEAFDEPADDDESEPGDPWLGAMVGRIEQRPSPERIRRALVVLKRIAALSDEDERVPEFTLIAWLYWALGLNSLSAEWLNRSMALAPTDSLARILFQMLEMGHLPDWAFVNGAAREPG